MPLNLPLRTDRLTLRDFEANDFEAVHRYASDPEVTHHMFYGPRAESDTRAYLKRMVASQRKRPRLTWELAVLQPSGRLVGACDLIVENDGEAALGFVLSQDVWGLGYATEVARALIRAGFEQLGLIRIFSTCDVANHASARVLVKAGLRLETTLEEYKYAKGQWWTSFVYSVRRDQWAANVT